MSIDELAIFEDHERANWVRLRTLVALRWFAIAGQTLAVLAAIYIYDLQLEIGLIALTIGSAVVGNLISTVVYPENRRLSEPEALATLVFDILQLGLLLALTGGLTNPFALLLLAPVTIAATFLHPRLTFLLAAIAILVILAIARWSLPLTTDVGQSLSLPPIFLFGFQVALLIGIVFLAVYARQVTMEMYEMRSALAATQLALAREQKLTDLGGVVAAAAHELGTPLATIKLTATELSEDLQDREELADDARLIVQQADRCRDILRSMGRAGKEDEHMRRVPVESLLREAAEPHMERGVDVIITAGPRTEDAPMNLTVWRSPEIIHGLRNLVQNAVDFAKTEIEIEAEWTNNQLRIRIMDDGPGFPPSVLGRIGEPYMRRRRQSETLMQRPAYEGMGLGLFIAKTLLERTGARLNFANAGPDGHAVVAVDWPRAKVETDPSAGGLGENRLILP